MNENNKTSKREKMVAEEQNIIQTCEKFFRNHGRGPTNTEIKLAVTDKQDEVLRKIKKMVNLNILKKEYYQHKPTGVWHCGYVPLGLEDIVKRGQEEENKNKRRMYWYMKVPFYSKIMYLIIKWTQRIWSPKFDEAYNYYLEVTEPAIKERDKNGKIIQ